MMEYDLTAIPRLPDGRIRINRLQVETSNDLIEMIRVTEDAWVVDYSMDRIELRAGIRPIDLGIISYAVVTKPKAVE